MTTAAQQIHMTVWPNMNYKLIISQFSDQFLAITHDSGLYISEPILFRRAAREQWGFIVVRYGTISLRASRRMVLGSHWSMWHP
jgi:hypothetical protein